MTATMLPNILFVLAAILFAACLTIAIKFSGDEPEYTEDTEEEELPPQKPRDIDLTDKR